MKLLILYPQYYYDHKMSRGRRDVIDHLVQIAGAVISGVGWVGWDEKKILRENISNIMPDAEAIIWYKAGGHAKGGVAPIRDSKFRVPHIPAIAIYNEAYWTGKHAAYQCSMEGTDLVIHHHLVDADQFGETPAVHIPHCANDDIYTRHAKPWGERSHELLVTGALDLNIYPLRTRIANMILCGRLRGNILKHPGYRLKDGERCRLQRLEYAKLLGNAKMVVCCASKHNYGLAKYVEAAMAGACVVGDIPPDFERTLGPAMLPLDNRWTDDQLCNAIKRAMPASEAGGQFCQSKALQHHSIDGYCNRLLGVIQGFISQQQLAARTPAA